MVRVGKEPGWHKPALCRRGLAPLAAAEKFWNTKGAKGREKNEKIGQRMGNGLADEDGRTSTTKDTTDTKE